MKQFTDAIDTHLQQSALTLCQCWKVERTDEVILGFTNHTRTLVVDGITYDSVAGLMGTAMKTQEGLAVDNAEINAFLTAQTERDLEAGKFDYAKVTIFEINYQDLTAGSIIIGTGVLGEVKRVNGKFTAELRGLRQKLDTRIGQTFLPVCNARLGDEKCRVILEDFSLTDVLVTFAASTRSLTLHSGQDVVSFLTEGFRAGQKVVITGSASNNFTGELLSVSDTLMVFVEGVTVVNEASTTIDLTTSFNFVLTGTVTTVDANSPRRIFGDVNLLFLDSSTPPTNWFAEGNITFTSGENEGIKRDVRSSAGGNFTTKFEFPFDVEVGDTFRVEAGCDKRFQTCKDKYNNVKNFRGFPHIPTVEDIFASPVGF